MITLELTDEEASELMRTLMGRLDLNLSEEIKKCTKVENNRVISVNEDRLKVLLHMKDVNQSVFKKLLDKGVNFS